MLIDCVKCEIVAEESRITTASTVSSYTEPCEYSGGLTCNRFSQIEARLSKITAFTKKAVSK
jgi:hypothetical protein